MPEDVMVASDPGAADVSASSGGDTGALAVETSDVQSDALATTTDTNAAVDNASLDNQLQPAEGEQPLATQPTADAGATLRSALKNLAKNPDPEVAKLAPLVQSTLDRLAAYTQHFPTIADAREFATAFPGGVKEAVASAQRALELDEVDNAFYSRDPQQHAELAKSWAGNDPEAFSVMSEAAIGVLAETNPQAYQALGSKVLEGTLQSLYRTALGTGNAEAAGRIDQLMKDVFGRAINEQPRTDPREAQLRARETELTNRAKEMETRTASEFATSSNQQAGQALVGRIQASLNTALGKLNVSDKAKERISQEIYDDINTKLMGDRGLQTKLQQIAQQGRRAGFTAEHRSQWVNAINQRAAAILGASAKDVIDRWTQDYLGVAGAKRDKVSSAAGRRDVGGGGAPDLSLPKLTGDKMLDMSQQEIMAYKGPVDPNWKQQMRDAKFGVKPAR